MKLEELQKNSWVRVIDDDEAMRKSWEFLIEGEGWRVRSYDSAESFLDNDDFEEYGCVVLDVRMPEMSGIELQRLMSLKKIGLPIIFVSAHGDIDMAVQALKDGAMDFLPKPVSADRLLNAIAKAVQTDFSQREEFNKQADARRMYETLTPREKMVAKKVALGLLNKQVAQELNISEKTVQVHRGMVYRKLGVKNAVSVLEVLKSIHEEELPNSD